MIAVLRVVKLHGLDLGAGDQPSGDLDADDGVLGDDHLSLNGSMIRLWPSSVIKKDEGQ